MHDSSLVAIERNDGVAVLTLANPPLNVVTLALRSALDGRLEAIAGDAGTRAVVIRGSSGAFCAGSNIREFPDLIARGVLVDQKLKPENETFSKLANLRCPTVAAIHGLALGGGLELALCADFIVCDEDARLGLPEILLGGLPGSGGTVRATRRIGPARAKRLMLLGEPIPARTAFAWGLVDELAPKAQVDTVAMDLALRLARGPAQALQACKELINTAVTDRTEDALDRVISRVEEIGQSVDFAEGVAAFLAKREAHFGVI